MRGWEHDSIGAPDSRLRVSRINAAHSSLRDRKWDGHIRSPSCHVTRGLRIGFRNRKRDRAQPPDVLHEPSCLATTVVRQQLHCLWSQWVIEGGLVGLVGPCKQALMTAGGMGVLTP